MNSPIQNPKSKIYNLRSLRHLCTTYGLAPSKTYGQNYLIEPSVIERIIEVAGVDRQDTVVEVGPGFGVLTMALSRVAGRVVAFEIEQKLRPYWDELEETHDNVEIIWGNVLHAFHSQDPVVRAGYKVVANLPYQITSRVIRTFLEADTPPESMTIMVQREVAERIVASPGSMSLLALSVQYYGEPQIVFQVSREHFWPVPKVDSAVLRINNIRKREESERFFRVAKAGFTNPRKQLWRNLANGLSLDKERVQEVLEEITGDARVRAEALSVLDWEKLTGKLL